MNRDNVNLYDLKEIEKKFSVVEIEKKLEDVTIDDLSFEVERRKKETCLALEKYKKKYFYNEETGEAQEKILGINDFVIDDYFFKPLNPRIRSSQKYNVEKLNIAFDLYKGIVTEINKNIKPFYPTISHLCLFLGINTREWNAYRNNVDIDMRDLITTIDDWIFDITMRLSEKKAIDNKTSMYRAKIEQNRVEQTAPNTVLIADGATIQEIQKRVKQLSGMGNEKVIEYGNKENN